MSVSIKDVEAAADRIAGDVVRTPTVEAPGLSRVTGCALRLKLENLQLTGSFKARGARNRLAALDRAKTPGVVACSAGNHAQGVAYFAERMAIAATIVMPRDTPFAKVESTQRYGARVILEGQTLAESMTHTEQLMADEKLTFIHPYDDDLIISGQGTAGLEMITDAPDLDCVVIPIGGGGLIAGCAVALKARKPDIEIIGVEAAAYATIKAATDGTTIASGGATLAEGIAVKNPGERTLPIVRALIDDIIVLEEAAIENAVELLADTGRIVAEGAGATPLGAVLEHRDRFAGRQVGLLVSGGNIDMRLFASVLLRGLVRGGQMIRLRVQISDSPGQLAFVSRLIGEAGGNIVEIIHQRMFYDVPVKHTDLDAVVETRNVAHAAEIVQCLEDAGLPTRLLSDVAGISTN
jgi:threonine dehydratase